MTSYTWLKKQPKYLWVNGVLPDFTWLTVRQTSSPGREIGKSNRRDTKYAVNELSWKPIKTMTEWCHAETDILTKGQGFQPLEKSWKPGKWKKLFPDLEKSWNLKKVQKRVAEKSSLMPSETWDTQDLWDTWDLWDILWHLRPLRQKGVHWICMFFVLLREMYFVLHCNIYMLDY